MRFSTQRFRCSKDLPVYSSSPQSQDLRAAVDAVKRTYMGWINELAAGLGYLLSFAAGFRFFCKALALIRVG